LASVHAIGPPAEGEVDCVQGLNASMAYRNKWVIRLVEAGTESPERCQTVLKEALASPPLAPGCAEIRLETASDALRMVLETGVQPRHKGPKVALASSIGGVLAQIRNETETRFKEICAHAVTRQQRPPAAPGP
jgi:hypothetical protein